MKKQSRVRSIQIGIQSLLRTIPPKALILQELLKHWEAIVGKNIAAHTSPADVARGALVIHVDDPIWIQELSLCKDDLKEAILDHLRKQRIPFGFYSLRFKNGPLVRYEGPAEEDAALSIDPATLARIDAAVADVADGELKEALRHYLVQSSLTIEPKKEL